MSYELALESLRAQDAPAPAFDALAGRVFSRRRESWQWWGAAASACGGLAFGAITLEVLMRASGSSMAWWASTISGSIGVAALLPCMLLLVASLLVLRRRVLSQTMTRAIWWSNLVVGTLMAHLLTYPIHRISGTLGALACGGAILIAGRSGLSGSPEDAADEQFRPAAFRGLLTLALVMAFADAQTLAFSALAHMGFGEIGWSWLAALDRAGFTIISAIVMGVAVWGLSRLRTWALLLNLIANFVIAGLALNGVLGLSLVVAATLAATACVQALLPVPILALAVGGPRAERSVFLHHGHRMTIALVVAAMAVATAGLARRDMSYSGWYEGSGVAFVRGMGGYVPPPTEDFSGADLRNERLDATLDGADFTDADARGARFGNDQLTSSRWVRTRLDDADFEAASLRFSRFVDLQLTRVNLRHADLRHTRFDRVVFADADLTGALLDRASFEDVTWRSTTCPDRSSSDDHGGTCEGAGVVASAADVDLVGEYDATPETAAFLARDRDKRDYMVDVQTFAEEDPEHDPMSVDVHRNWRFRSMFPAAHIRLAEAAVLLHRERGGFVLDRGELVVFEFSQDRRQLRVRFPDGVTLEYVRG